MPGSARKNFFPQTRKRYCNDEDLQVSWLWRFTSERERKDWVAKLSLPLSLFFRIVSPFPVDTWLYHGMRNSERITGLERKNRVASRGTPPSWLFDGWDFNLSQSRRRRSRDYVAGQQVKCLRQHIFLRVSFFLFVHEQFSKSFEYLSREGLFIKIITFPLHTLQIHQGSHPVFCHSNTVSALVAGICF